MVAGPTTKESDVESFFKRKLPRAPADGATALVLVEEHQAALGAGRVLLEHAASLVAGAGDVRVLRVQLETYMAPRASDDDCVEVLNFAGDLGGWLAPGDAMTNVLASVTAAAAQSGTPVILFLDSLTPLLQAGSFHIALQSLRALLSLAGVVGLVGRYNASLHPKHVVHALRAQATAFMLVETPASIAAYHFLSKESKRTVPPTMDGVIVFVRKIKNGTSTEATDCFRLPLPTAIGPLMELFAWGDATKEAKDDVSEPASALQPSDLVSTLAPDVSFNLRISDTDQKAKDQVQLPYMQTSSSSSSGAPKAALFYIDEDDPDWDDDDLDDDLDI
ncbi:hypothetical protein SPRG_15950 [Saprolegnia parasitica CBS 223.65]|uniref:Elongator complex protein 5 n=1 Tax=Saprolegnia parasitica (strain CBS 223.65) TaxID=695850 RepID=A0A067BW00_SAPPC|nr:hypothetical protein SPRG_15950 [Saprolegnia parasitica CBS 223.65]KDO18762.1 hypothetical protein SPRG_15950 [Saprolegnia parasitica CBS 223.65]|eukprot:XP_012210540.1 hypothetical protein SPRG_15950 [Saprolegnia parasitica CBS 223.65]